MPMRFPWQPSTPDERRTVRRLRARILAALVLVSAVPFLLLGGGAWIVLRDLAIERTLTLHRTILRAHASAVDRYLAEQVRTLETITRTIPLAELRRPDGLGRVFAALAEVHGDAFVDLGVIDAAGRHLAYVGPYDLLDRRYADAAWFRDVAARASIVSDVFLGFRQVPHSVIAVRHQDATGWWILRATLDSRRLDALVRSIRVGERGDVFVVNRDGVYQTPPRDGAVLGQSPLGAADLGRDLPDRRVASPQGPLRQVATGLNDGRWMLVVQQPEREILAPVTRALALGTAFGAAALVLALLTIVPVAGDLTRRIEHANRERDRMYADLLRSAKLASLGELATGLAHEINNPLQTIGAEQTNLGDLAAAAPLPDDVRAALQRSVERCRRQVARCAGITAKMLQFGRNTGTRLQSVRLEPPLREIVELLERRARLRDIALRLEIAPVLPAAWLDGNELEQVLVNLVNNAFDAMPRGGTVTIAAAAGDGAVVLTVRDEGCGIPEQDLDAVFQPFFTTKPPGEGTGLGLSVAYGLVRGWGGTIHAESAPGHGTTMVIRLPVAEDARPPAPHAVAAGQGEGRP